MKNIILFSFSFFLSISLFAQKSINYDDVLVITNNLSPESKEITRYFQAKRNIPAENIINIEIFPSETISELELDEILKQVKHQLLAHSNLSEQNYIVTTKGVPLKVNDYCGKTIQNCKSVDEELTTILSNKNAIVEARRGAIMNPYYNIDSKFSRSEFDIFLVTRLDGYNVDQVKNLIDRSANMKAISAEDSHFAFDAIASPESSLSSFLNKAMIQGISGLDELKCNISADLELGALSSKKDLLGLSIHSAESSFAAPSHTMLPGSIGELGYGNSGTSFDQEHSSNKIFAGEYIKNGITGLSAYTHVTFLTPMTDTKLLFNRYFSPNVDYNLAESFYGAKEKLKLHRVVIGDPKSSVRVNDECEVVSNISELEIDIFPNPSKGRLNIFLPKGFEGQLLIYDNIGQLKSSQTINSTNLDVDLSKAPKGLYYFTFTGSETLLTKRVFIN